MIIADMKSFSSLHAESYGYHHCRYEEVFNDCRQGVMTIATAGKELWQ